MSMEAALQNKSNSGDGGVLQLWKPELSEQIFQFLQTNEISCSDSKRLVDHLIKEGVETFKDLEYITLDNLKEEHTGMPRIQQQKFLKILEKHFRLNSTAKRDFASPLFGQGVVVESLSNPFVAISVRYILCRDLFIQEVKERIAINLYLTVTTMRDLIHQICSDQKIDDLHQLELFTHEGYPIDINLYNENCELKKWGFQDHSLVYAFVRKKEQSLYGNALEEFQDLDTSSGTHTISIHSVLHGNFSIAASSKDTGYSIKQKVTVAKGIHPQHFELRTRPKNYSSAAPQCIDMWESEKIELMLDSTDDEDDIELTLTMLPLYKVRSGAEFLFGKCTYNPMIEQTDQGYAKFYSILKYMVHSLTPVQQSKLLTFLHRDYDLPPLTYALRVLLSEHSLEQFSSWVALIEGFYQLFSAILKELFQVPENQVFECSDHLFGMLLKESKKVEETECILWNSTSLVCQLSFRKLVEPVTLPRCDGIFEKQVICQQIKSQTAVPGCDIKDLSEDKIKVAEGMERLLMLSDFQNTESFITWDIEMGTKKSIGPVHLPAAATWEYIYRCKDEFFVTDNGEANSLSYYKGKMIFITRVMKDSDLAREVYDPVYDPVVNKGFIAVQKDNFDSKCSKNMDLKDFVKPNIRSALESSVLQMFKRSNGASAVEDIAPKLRKEPAEAIVVVLDCSRSMNTPIFDDSTKHGQHMDRLTAAKQMFFAFLNRTEGFTYHHAVGLVSCSMTPKVEVHITDNYRLFEDQISKLKTSKGTALYDSMIKGSELLLDIQKKYPRCKRRLFCLTDGEDLSSKCKIDKCFELLRKRDILVDSVLIIGDKGNVDQKALSHGTGGFCFHPKSMTDALKIFETETILSSTIRQIRQEALLGTLSPYKDLVKYPYNSTVFYGQEDLRTQYAFDLSKGNYGNPARVVQHAALFSEKAERSNLRTQRILQEIQYYLRDPHPHIDIYPQEENITRWKIVLIGPEDTPYEGGTFVLYAKFPESYPQKPPEIRFETPIYHCNISSNGRICHASLDTMYVPRTKVKVLLEYVYGLLMFPEPSDPLDSVLALEFLQNEQTYKERARELVQKFAMGHDRSDIRKEIVKDDGDAPSQLICPLTGKLFMDPVMTQYGRTYERKALIEYLESHNSMDPLVNKPVTKDKIIPNINLKEMVMEYRKTLKK